MGGGVNIIEGPLLYEILNIFSCYILTYLENFIWLAWVVKNFEGPVGGGLQLWHLVIFYLPILILFIFYINLFRKFHVSSLNGRKVWILKDPIEEPRILVP